MNPPVSYCSSESPAGLWACFGFISTYLDHCHQLLFNTPQLGLGESDIKEILLTLTWDTHEKSVSYTYDLNMHDVSQQNPALSGKQAKFMFRER